MSIPLFVRCTLLLLVSSSHIAIGQEPDGRAEEGLKVTTAWAQRYKFDVEAGGKWQTLNRHPSSLLRWSNPVAGEIYGNVFVWTHEGRPEVVGSLLQWYAPHDHGSHEFHSLSTDPVRGSRDDRNLWKSEQPGIELAAVPDQSEVGSSPFVRLRQMRSISRGFSVEKTDRDDNVRTLRLLSQPLYRYGSDAGGENGAVLDGALFVFVQGTDPEVFLLLEARQEGETRRWHYGLARMNSVKFVASYKDREVWRVEIWPWSRAQNGREIYFHSGRLDSADALAGE